MSEPSDFSAIVPDGIPPWLWRAVLDLYGHRERFDGEEMNAAQVAQDSEEGRYEWCRLAAELLNTHMAAARKAQRRTSLPPEPDPDYRTVPFTMFGETLQVPLAIYEGGKRLDHPEPRWDATLWVERGEDWYGLRNDRRTLVVTREDWLSARASAEFAEMTGEAR